MTKEATKSTRIGSSRVRPSPDVPLAETPPTIALVPFEDFDPSAAVPGAPCDFTSSDAHRVPRAGDRAARAVNESCSGTIWHAGIPMRPDDLDDDVLLLFQKGDPLPRVRNDLTADQGSWARARGVIRSRFGGWHCDERLRRTQRGWHAVAGCEDQNPPEGAGGESNARPKRHVFGPSPLLREMEPAVTKSSACYLIR